MKTEHKKNAELRISFLDGKMMGKKRRKRQRVGKIQYVQGIFIDTLNGYTFYLLEFFNTLDSQKENAQTV